MYVLSTGCQWRALPKDLPPRNIGPGCRQRWDYNGSPLFRTCDVLDIDALRAVLDEIHAALGPASVLVNNAANDRRQDFATVTPDEFDRSISVNLRHVYFASQAIVPQMRALGGGSIINISSVAWMAGGPDL